VLVGPEARAADQVTLGVMEEGKITVMWNQETVDRATGADAVAAELNLAGMFAHWPAPTQSAGFFWGGGIVGERGVGRGFLSPQPPCGTVASPRAPPSASRHTQAVLKSLVRWKSAEGVGTTFGAVVSGENERYVI